MGAKVRFSFDDGLSRRAKQNLLRSLTAQPDVLSAAFVSADRRAKHGIVEFNRSSGVMALIEKMEAVPGVDLACRL